MAKIIKIGSRSLVVAVAMLRIDIGFHMEMKQCRQLTKHAKKISIEQMVHFVGHIFLH